MPQCINDWMFWIYKVKRFSLLCSDFLKHDINILLASLYELNLVIEFIFYNILLSPSITWQIAFWICFQLPLISKVALFISFHQFYGFIGVISVLLWKYLLLAWSFNGQWYHFEQFQCHFCEAMVFGAVSYHTQSPTKNWRVHYKQFLRNQLLLT